MNKPAAFLFALSLLILSIAYPQELQSWNEDTIFIISELEFEVIGHTRESALIDSGEFIIGEEIRGRANFEQYIRDKTQLLVNQRVLQENVEITYTIAEPLPTGAYPVTLRIWVEDSWNFFIFPVPRYNTNDGLDLILRIRDFNFLGTMNPLRIDLSYRYDQYRRHSFNLRFNVNHPFRLFDRNWNLGHNTLFGFRPQMDDPLYLESTTGISMQVPFRATTFTFGFEESFNLNKENLSRHWETFGETQSGFFMASRMFALWEIPTPLTLSRFGQLTYTPSISATINHRFPAWPLESIHRGPFLDFGHSLGFERINWYGNFRQGISAFLENSNRLDFFDMQGRENLSSSITITGIKHFIFTDFFAISARLQYRYWFYHNPAFHDLAGESIRGIQDNALSADYMLSLNVDLPFRLPMFAPSRWFNSERLRVFDIEFHLVPIIDMALYNDPRTETSFSPENIVIGSGLELMVFPAFIRNLYFRVSAARTFRGLTLPRIGNYEIAFMMGHFF